MGLVTKSYTFSAGTTIVAAEHNTNFDTLYNLVNGNIENTNIKANAAIANTKLASPNSYFTVCIHHEGQETSTVDPLAAFQMPFAATLTEVSCHARDIDTTDADETYTVDVEEEGTSVLSSAISIAADDTCYVGTISDSAIADNAKVEVVLTLGGTSPAINDLTVLLTFKVGHVT